MTQILNIFEFVSEIAKIFVICIDSSHPRREQWKHLKTATLVLIIIIIRILKLHNTSTIYVRYWIDDFRCVKLLFVYSRTVSGSFGWAALFKNSSEWVLFLEKVGKISKGGHKKLTSVEISFLNLVHNECVWEEMLKRPRLLVYRGCSSSSCLWWFSVPESW